MARAGSGRGRGPDSGSGGSGLNFADTMARVGFYPATPKRPCVLAMIAGEVETVGAGVSTVLSSGSG